MIDPIDRLMFINLGIRFSEIVLGISYSFGNYGSSKVVR